MSEVQETPPREEELKFLRELIRWSGAATPQEIGPQTSQDMNRARQLCQRRGWAEFIRPYWRITEKGRAAVESASK